MNRFDEEPDGDPHGECAAEITRLSNRVAELEAQTQWISVAERMPAANKTVLVYYLNRNGLPRRVRACWIAAKTQESSADSEIGEYDALSDTHFDPEGWYERIDNWDDYSSVVIHEGVPTCWMDLPPPPAQEETK